MMHQYIREQADALAQKRLEEYQQPREWGGDMKSQGKCHLIKDRSLEEGDQIKVDQILGQGLLRKKPNNRKYLLSQE